MHIRVSRSVSLIALSVACLVGAAPVLAQDTTPAVPAAASSSGTGTAAQTTRRGRRAARTPRVMPMPLETRDNYWGNAIGLTAGNFALDYGYQSPNLGKDTNQLGFATAGLFKLDTGLGLNVNMAYNNVSGSGSTLENIFVGGALVKYGMGWRGGVNTSYQNTGQGGFSTDTYAYGGFFDYYPVKDVTLSGKVGGFSWSPGGNGFYVGGQGEYYPTSHIGLGLSVDYTNYSEYSTASTSMGLFAEKLINWGCAPLTFRVAYTHDWETPGDYQADTFRLSLRVATNGERDRSLINQDRNGPLGSFYNFNPYPY